jgi:hypothetical protein
MAGELVVQLWKEWGLQALVLLSFTLQVVLLILLEFHRSMDSGVLRLVLIGGGSARPEAGSANTPDTTARSG